MSNASALLRIGLAPRARQKTRYPNPEPENPNLNPKSQKKKTIWIEPPGTRIFTANFGFNSAVPEPNNPSGTAVFGRGGPRPHGVGRRVRSRAHASVTGQRPSVSVSVERPTGQGSKPPTLHLQPKSTSLVLFTSNPSGRPAAAAAEARALTLVEHR